MKTQSPEKSAMAPRDTPKHKSPKVQRRTIVKGGSKTRTPVSTIKKTMSAKNAETKVNTTMQTRQRTSTVPIVATPKPKEKKSAPMPGSVKKPAWKRRPKPAHSGVPVPEKMKRLMEKQLQDSDCSM